MIDMRMCSHSCPTGELYTLRMPSCIHACAARSGPNQLGCMQLVWSTGMQLTLPARRLRGAAGITNDWV